jgi:Fe-S cluster assembly iron-binding protein IscA
MALDEPKESDNTYEIDGFKYIIDKDFLEKAQPIKVDFAEYGFKISSGIDFSAFSNAGCSGCGTSSNCG